KNEKMKAPQGRGNALGPVRPGTRGCEGAQRPLAPNPIHQGGRPRSGGPLAPPISPTGATQRKGYDARVGRLVAGQGLIGPEVVQQYRPFDREHQVTPEL